MGDKLRGGTTIGGYIVAHLGNLLDLIKKVDGVGSGIDADLLNGKGLASSGTADTVVARDVNGDINVRLVKQSYASANATVNYIMTQIDQATNNYLRPSTPAQVLAALLALPMSATLNMADQILQRPIIKDYGESLTTNAAATGTVTLDIATANVFHLTISGATTLVFSNPTATGNACSITIKINMPATLYAITWPTTVRWNGGTAPTFIASKTAILTFMTVNGGTLWYGMPAGNNFATA